MQCITTAPKRQRYAAPSLDHLRAIARTVRRTHRAEVAHPPELDRVTAFADEDLAERFAILQMRPGRGLSELDEAVQREWTARSLGFGYWYGRTEPQLPQQLRGLLRRRAPIQELVLAAVCTAMAKELNGTTLSAPEAEALWGVGASAWWAAHRALEARGLVTRARRYKNNCGPEPVHLCPNWYGPGPKLLAIAPAVLAAYGVGEAGALAGARGALLGARRTRRRVTRRREADRRRRRDGLIRGRLAPSSIAVHLTDGPPSSGEFRFSKALGRPMNVRPNSPNEGVAGASPATAPPCDPPTAVLSTHPAPTAEPADRAPDCATTAPISPTVPLSGTGLEGAARGTRTDATRELARALAAAERRGGPLVALWAQLRNTLAVIVFLLAVVGCFRRVDEGAEGESTTGETTPETTTRRPREAPDRSGESGGGSGSGGRIPGGSDGSDGSSSSGLDSDGSGGGMSSSGLDSDGSGGGMSSSGLDSDGSGGEMSSSGGEPDCAIGLCVNGNCSCLGDGLCCCAEACGRSGVTFCAGAPC